MFPEPLWGFGRILGSGIIRISLWKHFLSLIRGKANELVTRRRMSRLTARIMAIMLFPLAIFLLGLAPKTVFLIFSSFPSIVLYVTVDLVCALKII